LLIAVDAAAERQTPYPCLSEVDDSHAIFRSMTGLGRCG
jgi:hypothetical protein